MLGAGEHGAIGAGIDQCAGWTCCVVEQRLVPAGRGVMRIDRDGSRLYRAHPVVIVDRVEERQMQDRRQRRTLVETHRAATDRIVVGLWPTISTRHKLHAIGPQRIELADLKTFGTALARIGAADKIEERMGIALGGTVVKNEA